MDANEALRKGAEYIAEKGWHQGALIDHRTGSVCAMGALALVTGVQELVEYEVDGLYVGTRTIVPSSLSVESYTDRQKAFQDALTKLAKCIRVQGPHTVVPAWNDDEHTTAEDVILTMKRAAEE